MLQQHSGVIYNESSYHLYLDYGIVVAQHNPSRVASLSTMEGVICLWANHSIILVFRLFIVIQFASGFACNTLFHKRVPARSAFHFWIGIFVTW
jgi:hypothetical protein